MIEDGETRRSCVIVPSTSYLNGHDFHGANFNMRAKSSSAAELSVNKRARSRERGSNEREETTTKFRRGLRSISMQFIRHKENEKLSPETLLQIKTRYKDTSKYIIWPECPFPRENELGYLTLNPDISKRSALRYKYAGNHQGTIVRVGDSSEAGSKFQMTYHSQGGPSIYESPEGLKLYHRSISAILAAAAEKPDEPRKNGEVKTLPRNVANIEDDQTPAPLPIINSHSRSESSGDDEPLINITDPSKELAAYDYEHDFHILRL
ncbi:hypothetical protein AB6A40_002037 [Gnathostoma spinigerum]|uniref:IRS-type PTB domain-containing protein n=1 Tax=Gnathostoma spinigerum TaxID=75299 RepID=A0ABD6EEN0_9BILA